MRHFNNGLDEEDGSSGLYEFFKDMVEGNFSKRGDMDNDVPFMLNFSQYRRKRIIDAIVLKNKEDEDKRKEGQRILNVNSPKFENFLTQNIEL